MPNGRHGVTADRVDAAGGSVLRSKWGLPLENARFATPDLAAIARAIGIEAIRITSLDQFDGSALRLAVRLVAPLFLECTITGEPTPSILKLKRSADTQI